MPLAAIMHMDAHAQDLEPVTLEDGVFKSVNAFVTIENAFDRRNRAINARAYTNSEELIGAPQNPRRIAVGFDLLR